MKKLINLDDSGIHYGLYARFVKRPLDFFICLVALLILSPILLILCILIKIKLGSPIFFKQTRCGRDERPFEMIKFRTMTDERDDNGNLLPDTERFTKFGDFLRNYSLDELPELINVIKGDMSIIGPRPLYTFYVPYYTEEEALRHVVRGGITGLAQVNGRALCRWNDRFAYDVKYVRHITFLTDLKILWNTVCKVLKKSDIGVPSVTDEGGLHIVREVQRPDRIKEIGGSFSCKNISKKSKNYPTFIIKNGGENRVIYLSTGRSCIREILRSLDVANRRAIIPGFTCESVVKPFCDAGFTVQPYAVNGDLSIDLQKLEELVAEFDPSIVLFHRLFGFDTCKGIETIINRPGIVTIEDQTQFMFSEPSYGWSNYQIGSIRKWGSFPDGAYLKSRELVINQPLEEDVEFVKMEADAMDMKQSYLDKISTSTDYLRMFASARQYVDDQKKTYSISSISNYNLQEMDEDELIKRRRTNARILVEGLQGYSWFTCVFDSVPRGITPFMIPIRVHHGRKDFQVYLTAQRIFATVIWGCPEELIFQIGKTDRMIYDQILCIPCDQRYDETDMRRIVRAIRTYDMKKGKNVGI